MRSFVDMVAGCRRQGQAQPTDSAKEARAAARRPQPATPSALSIYTPAQNIRQRFVPVEYTRPVQ